MKQFILSIFMFSSIYAQSQTACKIALKKGQKLNYTSETAPNVMDHVTDFYYLSKSKQKKAKEAFDIDVAAGKIKGKSYDFYMTVSDVKPIPGGAMYEVEYVMMGTKYYSYNVCKNDTIIGVKSKSGYYMVNEKKDTIGFTIPGITTYPTGMKVGDVLPIATDLAYTFPKNIDLPQKRMVLDHMTSYETKDYYITTKYFKEITTHITFTVNFSAPTITYRTVESEEEITFNGKTYKALKIALMLETKVEDMVTNVNADDLLTQWLIEFTNRQITKNVNKHKDLKHSGYEWYIPELGIIVNTELYDGDGKWSNKARLLSVE